MTEMEMEELHPIIRVDALTRLLAIALEPLLPDLPVVVRHYMAALLRATRHLMVAP